MLFFDNKDICIIPYKNIYNNGILVNNKMSIVYICVNCYSKSGYYGLIYHNNRCSIMKDYHNYYIGDNYKFLEACNKLKEVKKKVLNDLYKKNIIKIIDENYGFLPDDCNNNIINFICKIE